MTLEEAKNILEKEGFSLEGPGRKSCAVSEAFMKYESPEVCEAMQVVCTAGYMIKMFGSAFNARKERLKKEYEKNTKAPGPGEDQPKEKVRIICCSAFPKADFYYKHVLNEDNPALKEAASQFNDALLDEQAKKIAELTKDKELMKKATLSQLDDFIEIYNLLTKESQKAKRLGKEIARLNGIIHDKNEELKRKTKGCCELITEDVDLKKKLSDKDAVLADVAEELRLSKIREKNLTELCQKYIKANEELKEKLADKVVDKIDVQALKSAESALAYKEKVISDLQEKLKSIKKNRHNERVYKKKLVEKDEVIEKLQKQLKYKSPLPSGSVEAINIYVDNISRARRGGFNESVSSTMGETELSETYEYGDKKLKYALHFNEDGSITYECSDPDKKNRHNGDGLPSPEEPKHDNSFEDFISKTIDNFNRRAAELGCVGSKDGNGILDQMVGVDIAEEGADHSDVIVMCGKDFIDAIKKMK